MMGVRIKIGEIEAEVEDGQWSCSNDLMLMLLQTFTPDQIEGYTPSIDFSLAQMAAKFTGGFVIIGSYKPEYIEGRIY